MTTHNHSLPRLRAIDPQPGTHNGRRVVVLRDPLQISDSIIAIPYELAPLLVLCDGTRDAAALRASLMVQYRIDAPLRIIDQFLAACDQALLLDNETFANAQAQRLAEYRAAPFRPPALAGAGYPEDPQELAAEFEGYGRNGSAKAGSSDEGYDHKSAAQHTGAAGVISPHIDYQRGGPVYAGVWREARDLVRQADVAVVFGTDHYGGVGELTLTRQNYATPFGTLPTPPAVVDALAKAVGPTKAFHSELHHRNEHSIELAVTWLHYVRRDLPPLPVVPILCGSFQHFVEGQGRPAGDPSIAALVQTLLDATSGQRLLVVAGADLAHVGPAFGGPPQGAAECRRLHAADEAIMTHACACDAAGFFEEIRQVGDQYSICGLAPIYLALRTLAAASADQGPLRGKTTGYDKCPADDAGTSFVSICGVVLQ